MMWQMAQRRTESSFGLLGDSPEGSMGDGVADQATSETLWQQPVRASWIGGPGVRIRPRWWLGANTPNHAPSKRIMANRSILLRTATILRARHNVSNKSVIPLSNPDEGAWQVAGWR